MSRRGLRNAAIAAGSIAALLLTPSADASAGGLDPVDRAGAACAGSICGSIALSQSGRPLFRPTGSAASGPTIPMVCNYYPDQQDDPTAAGDAAPLRPDQTKQGDWVWVSCQNSETFEPIALYRTQIGADGLPTADPATVAQDAFAMLQVPTPQPKAWPPLDQQIVGLRTWLHVDGFEPQSATATAGDVSATVTVNPTQVVWHLGTDGTDDATVTCNGPGTIWHKGQPDDATDCSYLFQHYSAGQTMTGSVEVVYHASWTSNLGVGGDLGELSTQADLAVRVWEIQAQIN